GRPGRPSRPRRFSHRNASRLLVVHGLTHLILHAADRVLHLAGGLLGCPFGFGLAVARYLAGDFLHLAFGLTRRAFDPVLVHVILPLEFAARERTVRAQRGSMNGIYMRRNEAATSALLTISIKVKS